jgi:FkbM family methyltransferase
LGAFYSQFIKPNDLVFDIGANIGVYAEVFQSIGARVVAVEPDPACSKEIAWTTSRDRVTIVQAAVGDQEGFCKLFVNELSILNTVSKNWVEKEKANKPYEIGMWKNEIEVPMVTIDKLVAKYGIPRFIKLDVEGFELSVLSGMSSQPEYLSFEFHADTLDKDEACFEKLSPSTQYDFTINEPFKFEIGRWVSREEVWNRILAGRISTCGELFARMV